MPPRRGEEERVVDVDRIRQRRRRAVSVVGDEERGVGRDNLAERRVGLRGVRHRGVHLPGSGENLHLEN